MTTAGTMESNLASCLSKLWMPIRKRLSLNRSIALQNLTIEDLKGGEGGSEDCGSDGFSPNRDAIERIQPEGV
jgi:hypothetical protein